MSENQRDFKGVWIPKAIWLDSRLTALDKVILTEIDSLDQSERGCFASNKHIADFCQCSERKVSESISQLLKFGYIRVQNFDGRQRELRSCLAKNASLDSTFHEADTKKLRQSNTRTKPSTNTTNKREKKPFIPPTLEEVEAYCKSRNNNVDAKRFWDYFDASDWVDGKGNKVRNWKQKVITWESYNKDVKQDGQATGDTGKVRIGHYL
jgi:hypothetical protein